MSQGDFQPSPQSTPASTVSPIVEGAAACNRCSYSLVGLPISGVCPECGQPVAASLRGFLLQFASPDYIATVRSGLSFILNGILLQILLMVVGVVLAFAFRGAGGVTLLLMGGNLVCALIIFLGYLKATEADPSFVGTDRPTGARNVVRIAAVAQIALTFPAIALELLGGTMDPGLKSILTGIVSLLSMIAWAVQFFAMMLYTRWLGSRVPDHWIIKRTKTYMWLLPLLTTVGVVLVGLGPIIALVLYWNLLDRMRKHLKSIESSGAPASLKNMAG
jgi:hypothetical protein